MQASNELLVMAGYVFLILIIPGPTNTLLLSSGVRKGLAKTIPLVFAEASGYFLAIILWGYFLLSIGKSFPSIYQWARILCAIYIFWLAFKVWRISLNLYEPKDSKSDLINVFIATLLNPKALLFSSSILPEKTFLSVDGFAYTMVVFLLVLFPIGVLWASLGNFVKISSRTGNYTGGILRIASVFLIFFSFLLAFSGTAKAEGKLVLYNWQSYTSPEMIKKFEEQKKVNVSLIEYKGSEEAFDAIQSNSVNADLAVVADNHLPDWIKSGLVESLNKYQLNNFRNIEPQWRSTPADSQREFSVPWGWGIVGVAVHSDSYSGDINTWSVVLTPPDALVGKINVGADMNEIIYAALRYHGGHMCDDEPIRLEKVRETLLKARPAWAAMEYGSITMMASGKFKASIDWNGAALRQRQINPNVKFGYPKEGTQIFSDNLVMIKTSVNKANAIKFIDFILQPENSALNSAYHGYDTAVIGSTAYLPASMKDAPELSIPEEVIRKSERSVICSDTVRRVYEDIWGQLNQ